MPCRSSCFLTPRAATWQLQDLHDALVKSGEETDGQQAAIDEVYRLMGKLYDYVLGALLNDAYVRCAHE